MISIIIPCYNEEARIGKTLFTIISYMKKQKKKFEIICVDDGSKDATVIIIKDVQRYHKNIRLLTGRPNRGKGYSVREGALAAKYDLLLFSDADLSTPISELKHLLVYAKSYDLVIGTRTDVKKLKRRQPKYREIMGKTFSLLKRMILGMEFKDTQCGFKLFTKKAKYLFKEQKVERFAFDVELLYLAQRDGLRIKEVPVIWLNDDRSKVSPFRDAPKMLLDVWKIKRMHKDD
jgi:dolichyl-phosphate beta-glucosyltransferase